MTKQVVNKVGHDRFERPPLHLVDELAVPPVLAVHAVWVIDDVYEVRLNARATRLLVAKAARDFYARFAIERVAAYWARHCASCFSKHFSFLGQEDTGTPFNVF